jgi:hypothetical protein
MLAFSGIAMASYIGFSYASYDPAYVYNYPYSGYYYYPSYYVGYYDYYPYYYPYYDYGYYYGCNGCGYDVTINYPYQYQTGVYTYTAQQNLPAATPTPSCSNKCNGNTLYYNGYYNSDSCQYSAMECSSLNSEEQRYCSGNDVFVREKNYQCMNGGCQSTVQSRFYQNCQNGCRNGVCISCDSSCSERSGFIGQKYCSGRDVVQVYREYYCSQDGCAYSDTQKVVETCASGCMNGVCGSCDSKCSGNVYYYNGVGFGTQCSYQTQNCDDLDREQGPRFCKDNDVYTKYRNYYCSGGCSYRLEDRLVEKCAGSCSNGYCNYGYAAMGSCQALDGYYGNSYCKDNDVYKIYRDYYQSGSICTFTQVEKLVQNCYGPCVDGACRNGCQNNCSSMNGWYCTSSGRELRTYTCDYDEICKYHVEESENVEFDRWVCSGYERQHIITRCINGIINQQITEREMCANGCSAGSCGSCNSDTCSRNSGFIGQRTCSSNNVYQTYRNYYCANEGCRYADSQRLVETCPAGCSAGSCNCVGQNCAIGGCIKSCDTETTLNFAVSVSSAWKDKSYYIDSTDVYSGVLQGEKAVTPDLPDGVIHNISFRVTNTNDYGDILVFIGNEIVYHGRGIGTHTTVLEKEVSSRSKLKIVPESSWWKVWAPDTYELGDVWIYYTGKEIASDRFEFEIQDNNFDSFARGDIISWPAGTSIKLNGRTLQGSSFGRTDVFAGKNALEVIPFDGTESYENLIVKLVYSGYCRTSGDNC